MPSLLHKNIKVMTCQCFLNTVRFKSTSSKVWLQRQSSDQYVKKARAENWRCRSAYKLLEINDRFHILKAGHVVIDCGASPGSWTQVAVREVNSDGTEKSKAKGTVLGIDLLSIEPIPGAYLLSNKDFTAKATQALISHHLKQQKVNVVLSDMAPNASGVKSMDHGRIVKLSMAVLKFAVENLQQGGCMLCKLWDGSETKLTQEIARRFFSEVTIVKPRASRSDSAEIYLLCTDFRLQKT